jgi:hypothetical protein
MKLPWNETMLTFDPAFWLIVLAVAVFALTAVIVVASSLIAEDDAALAAKWQAVANEEGDIARS